VTGHNDIESLKRWRSDFRGKPGPARPICSACGDDWPCEYERDRQSENVEEPT